MEATVDESEPVDIASDPSIHIPSHGRGWLRPAKKGQCLNPRGQIPHRVRLAREVAENVGLKELYELAHQVKRADGAVARALVETALDRSHKGHLAAQKLLWDLLGFAGDRAQLEFKQSLEVQVVRQKVRVMDMEAIEVAQEESYPPALSPPHQEASPSLGSLRPRALVGVEAEGAASGTSSSVEKPPSPYADSVPGLGGPSEREGTGSRSASVYPESAVSPSGLPPLVARDPATSLPPCPALENEIPKNGQAL